MDSIAKNRYPSFVCSQERRRKMIPEDESKLHCRSYEIDGICRK
jgi:hypothetical protein